ncbi:MAG TPA: type II CAAX endopeptidase family protein [Ferruginibacter sp.]|jgi:membrane protease YdiL (CAAX protease family)|nr:type II CAAX endopeptidase family protein [Ferruginibacter sp.]
MSTIISQETKRSHIVIGILLTILLLFAFPFLGSSPVLHLFGLSKVNGTLFFISRLIFWCILLVIFFYTKKVEKQPFLIWEERNYTFSKYVIAMLSIFTAILIGTALIQLIFLSMHYKEHSTKLDAIIAIFKNNIPLLIFTAITAGIAEELIFRGYLLPRLEVLFKNSYLAIFISSLLFGLMHFSFGTLYNVLGPFIIGLAFAYYYWKYRNIKLIIVFHFLWDIIALLVHVTATVKK